LSIERLEPRALLDGLGLVGGTVFDDLDRDGIRDPEEPGLPDWSVEIQRAGATDAPVRTFENPTPDEWSQFGRFVATAGDSVLVGSHYDNVAGPADAGAVYQFDAQTGGLVHTFLSPAPAEGDKFGRAVAGLGDHVLIGAPLDDSAGLDAGAVYLFDGHTHQLLHKFLNPQPNENDQFGRAIAAVGDDVLIGARFADLLAEDGATVAVEDAGAAFLFDGETGQLLQTYISPTPSEDAQFGYSVAAVGENVLVGARLDETGAAGVGAVYLFDGTSGNLLQSFVNPTQSASGNPTGFGRSVAAVGDNVLVGARWDDAGEEGGGGAFLFDAATGELLRTFSSPTPFGGEEFGFCVAALGNDVLVGARWDNRWDNLGEDSGGAAYLFDGSTGQLLQTFANPAPGAWDGFGLSVAGMGDRVVVGAQTGNAAYLFDAFEESARQSTDVDGAYRFEGLEPGVYRVRESVSKGYVQTAPGGSRGYMLTVDGDESLLGLDFGNVRNEPPVARDDSYTMGEDSVLIMNVLINDADADGDGLIVSLVNAPRHGDVLLLPGGAFRYLPDGDFSGSDSFTYRAHDGLVTSNLAAATVTVNPINDVPVAADNVLWAAMNTVRELEAPGVLADDVDVDGDLLTALLVDPPAHGIAVLQPDGALSYTPHADYIGPDEFSYKVSDGQTESDVVRVSITVTINAPEALKNYLRVSELNYHPYPLTSEERAAGIDDREAFEYIELVNLHDEPLDLAGVRFSEAVRFQFSGETLLGPGQRGLLVRDASAFETRYGAGHNVLGAYLEDFHNSGERLVVSDPFGRVIADFEYDDGGRWPVRADGFGSSLEIVNPHADPGSGGNWRAGVEYGGSPGTEGSEPMPTVVVNEVLSHANLPLTDTVELYNATDRPIDLGGWFLSESAGDYKKFRIPDGTIIGPGAYLVYDEYDFNPGRWERGAGGFALDSADGDDVWLTAADAAGNLTRFVDHVEFGAALRDESFGRWPNGEGQLNPMWSRTFGTRNSGPRTGILVISEIMYHPPGEPDSGGLEYIEILNPTQQTVDLRHWRVRGGVQYNFPAPHDDDADPVPILPGETILVVGFEGYNMGALSEFRNAYSIPASVQMFGPLKGTLGDEGEAVRLLRPDAPPWWEPHKIPHVLEEEVVYGVEEPWPQSPNAGGDALHRREIGLWARDPSSWIAAPPSPGTVDLQAGTLVVTEINYSPYSPTATELVVNPNYTAADFEFLELLNVSGTAVDLSGMQLTHAVNSEFSPGTTLDVGERGVIVGDLEAFQTRYGADKNVLGQFDRTLNNKGARITLTGSTGQMLLSFAYNDERPWPGRANGHGSSLELVNVYSNFSDGTSWRPSTEYGGSPGDSGSGPIGEVLINEVFVSAGDPAGGGVELYNAVGGRIDIGGWYLSDSGSELARFRIPDGTVIEAYGYVTFDATALTSPPDGPGFILDPHGNNDVYLAMTNPDGRVTHFADHVSFGASAEGESWGRWPSGRGELYPMTTPTLDPAFGTNAGPRVGPVVVSEVMYHPRTSGDLIEPNDLEYVEIFNSSNDPVELAGWRLTGGIAYTFGEDASLAPLEALLVVPFDPAEDDAAFEQFQLHYGIRPWMDVVGGFSGGLSNRGDSVRLVRVGEAPPNDPKSVPMLLEDEVIYDDESPWPNTADGFGYSLIRAGSGLWGNDVISWTANVPSPGVVESQVGQLAITELNYRPHDPTPAELAVNPQLGSEDFEFVELLNVTGETLDLQGMHFSWGVEFDFPATVLAPAERMLIVKNRPAFDLRYGNVSTFIAGEYDDVLDDEGERIAVSDGFGSTILHFTYDNDGYWPTRADGRGSSLEIVDLGGYYNDPDNWAPSGAFGGTPGTIGGGFSGDVVINEVLANPEAPELDVVELYNTTASAVDVGGWYLSNHGDDYFKYRIADDTLLPAHGYLVFDESDFNPNGAWNPAAGEPAANEFSLDDSGGEVWLVQTIDGVPTRFVDRVEYGSAAPGKSFGRYPDGGDEWSVLVYPTLGRDEPEQSRNYPARAIGSLVVTEVHYQPSGDDDAEFIELYNASPFPYDLTGLRFIDGISLNFDDGNVQEVGPWEYIVVVGDDDAFEQRYGTGVNVAGEHGGSLRNRGEQVVLTTAEGEVVFDLSYDKLHRESGWTDGFGSSLELIDPLATPEPGPRRTGFLEDPANWRASGRSGGSPGGAGSAALGDVLINEILVRDGEVTTVELFNPTQQPIDVGGWLLSVDSSGQGPVVPLAEGTTIPARGHLALDGLPFDIDDDDEGAVWLLQLDLPDTEPRIVDGAAFASDDDIAWGRWPDGYGYLYPMLGPTPGEVNAGPLVGPLVIAELNYNSAEMDDRDDLEFIEIYNTTETTVDLDDWWIEGGIEHNFDDVEIGPFGTLVLVSFHPAGNRALPENFRRTYGIDAAVVLDGDYDGRLSNGGECLRLLSDDGVVRDEVFYDDRAPWPVRADGHGFSLHRREASVWGNDSSNWVAAIPTPGNTELAPNLTAVVARHVFYNDSSFDGSDPSPSAADDAAMATDKQPLLPGQSATSANYTNYFRGINGIMLDVADLGNPNGLNVGNAAAFFRFRLGNTSDPAGWALAPQPTALTVRQGAGVDGSDRVTFTWPDYAIRNRWLEVRVLGGTDLGLDADDVFYFGNAVADAGNAAGNAQVTTTDVLLARNNPRNFLSPAQIDFHYDYNRDQRVNATDVLLARNNQTNFLTALRLIDLSGAAAAAHAVPSPAGVEAMSWLEEYESSDASSQPIKESRSAVSAADELLKAYWP